MIANPAQITRHHMANQAAPAFSLIRKTYICSKVVGGWKVGVAFKDASYLDDAPAVTYEEMSDFVLVLLNPIARSDQAAPSYRNHAQRVIVEAPSFFAIPLAHLSFAPIDLDDQRRELHRDFASVYHQGREINGFDRRHLTQFPMRPMNSISAGGFCFLKEFTHLPERNANLGEFHDHTGGDNKRQVEFAPPPLARTGCCNPSGADKCAHSANCSDPICGHGGVHARPRDGVESVVRHHAQGDHQGCPSNPGQPFQHIFPCQKEILS